MKTFETLAVGDVAPYAITFGETERSHVRVTDETAAGGRKSLRFTDASNLPKSHWPWFAYRPRFDTGEVRLSFALQLDPKARVQHEWRDDATPYVVGPCLRIGDGEVRAGDRLVARIPEGNWVHFDTRCQLGDAATGTYSLTLRNPATDPVHVAELPCPGGERFRSLNWLGFIGLSDADVVFYLDDIHLGMTQE